MIFWAAALPVQEQLQMQLSSGNQAASFKKGGSPVPEKIARGPTAHGV